MNVGVQVRVRVWVRVGVRLLGEGEDEDESEDEGGWQGTVRLTARTIKSEGRSSAVTVAS